VPGQAAQAELNFHAPWPTSGARRMTTLHNDVLPLCCRGPTTRSWASQSLDAARIAGPTPLST
jgi:hypothetical protein